MTAPLAGWARRHPVSAALGGAVLVSAVVVTLLGGSGSLVAGPDQPSSVTSTAPDGWSALAALAGAEGHPVVVERRRLDRIGTLSPHSTVVVAGQVLAPTEEAALARFLSGGGRVVLAGDEGQPARRLTGDGGLVWVQPGPVGPLRVSHGAPESIGLTTVDSDGGGRWTGLERPGPAPVVTVVGAEGHAAVEAAVTVGRGRVVLMADPGAWSDRLLTRDGNALQALDALGPGRPVVFSEASLSGTSWAALPASWRWAIPVLVAAWLALLWARGRRLGPHDPVEEEPAPSRRQYVISMAAALGRTGDPLPAIELLEHRASGSPRPAAADPEAELVARARQVAARARARAGAGVGAGAGAGAGVPS